MITVQEAQSRIALNRTEWDKQKSAGIFDPTKFYWYDACPKSISWATISGKIEDLIAALPVNALPILKQKHGADAYIVEDNMLAAIELKTTFVSNHTIWKSANDALYTGDKNEKDRRSTLKSSHAAKYSVSEDKLESKRMHTYIVLIEDKPGTHFPIIIDIYRLEADVVFTKLEECMKSQKNKMSADGNRWSAQKARSIELKFSVFETCGTQIQDSQIGYTKWEDGMKAIVPKLSKDEESAYYIQKSKIKHVKFLNSAIGKNSNEFLDWS